MSSELTELSKHLAYILRHNPTSIGLKLDTEGWASVSELIDKMTTKGIDITENLLMALVANDDKKRYTVTPDGLKIRAAQGHSIDIDLNLLPVEPPVTLYHGTAVRFWVSISKQGLLKRNRQYVHLSPDEKTAYKVGIRHGQPLILKIRSKEMFDKGYKFFLSDNQVWLTDSVPVEFIDK